MKEIYTYLRVSTDDKGQDPELQKEACETLAKKLDPEATVHTFIEEKSAWKDSERPIFNDMIQKAVKYGIKDIVVWDLDRVYRNRVKMVSLVKELARSGIHIRSTRQQWLDDIQRIPSPWNEIIFDLLLQIVAWMSEEESKKKSERVKLAVTKKYGKTVSKAGNRWGRPGISKFQRAKLRELSSKGLSVRAIADQMNITKTTVAKYLSAKGGGDK